MSYKSPYKPTPISHVLERFLVSRIRKSLLYGRQASRTAGGVPGPREKREKARAPYTAAQTQGPGGRRAPRKRNPETIYVKGRLLRFALPESSAKCRRQGIRDPVHARVAECEGGWNREKSRVKRRDWSDSVMVG